MTVESNCVMATATLNDWLKRLASVFQPMRSNHFRRHGGLNFRTGDLIRKIVAKKATTES